MKPNDQKRVGEFGIFLLNPKDAKAVKAIANLHISLIPDSSVANLGTAFMERFYYNRLVRQGLIQCVYYQYASQVVGFLVYTLLPNQFMRLGIRKNVFLLCSICGALLLSHPGRLIQLLKGLKIEKAHQHCDDREAAVLSFGVLPYFRSHKFIKENGIRISNELFIYVLDVILKNGYEKVRMIVGPENREALFFYKQFNCCFEKISSMGFDLIKVTCISNNSDD